MGKTALAGEVRVDRYSADIARFGSTKETMKGERGKSRSAAPIGIARAFAVDVFLLVCLCCRSPNNNNYANRMYAHLGRLCPHSSDNKLGVHKDIKTQEIS